MISSYDLINLWGKDFFDETLSLTYIVYGPNCLNRDDEGTAKLLAVAIHLILQKQKIKLN